MAEKKSAAKKSTPAKPAGNPNHYKVEDGRDGIAKGMTTSQAMAVLATRSAFSASTVKAYSGGGDSLEVSDLVDCMREAGEKVNAGDIRQMERMLVNQAIALDNMFSNLALKSSRQEYMKQMETYMRLALKAQAQARATVEAIAMLKNPQPYIRQANIANGNQQVNNMYATTSGHTGIHPGGAITGAGNSLFSQSKLLEAQDVERLDSGAQGAASGANQAVEALGAVNRP